MFLLLFGGLVFTRFSCLSFSSIFARILDNSQSNHRYLKCKLEPLTLLLTLQKLEKKEKTLKKV